MKVFSVCCIILAALFVFAAFAAGFAGIGIKSASGSKAAALEEMFGVELMQVTFDDGTKVPVVRTADGDYINVYDFLDAFHGKTTLVRQYTIDNGKITGEQNVIITFSAVQDPAKIKDTLAPAYPALV